MRTHVKQRKSNGDRVEGGKKREREKEKKLEPIQASALPIFYRKIDERETLNTSRLYSSPLTKFYPIVEYPPSNSSPPAKNSLISVIKKSSGG